MANNDPQLQFISENYSPGENGSDFDSDYGEEYYPPGFKLRGEKTYEAVWRWWETCNEDDREAFNARSEINSVRSLKGVESIVVESSVAQFIESYVDIHKTVSGGRVSF